MQSSNEDAERCDADHRADPCASEDAERYHRALNVNLDLCSSANGSFLLIICFPFVLTSFDQSRGMQGNDHAGDHGQGNPGHHMYRGNPDWLL